jgi:hypothetical protein
VVNPILGHVLKYTIETTNPQNTTSTVAQEPPAFTLPTMNLLLGGSLEPSGTCLIFFMILI